MATTIVNQPKVTINIASDQVAITNSPFRVLAVGQQLAVGTAVSGELQLQIGNDFSEDTLFGTGSMLAAMIRRFKGTAVIPVNRVTRIDAIGLDDNVAAVEATGNVDFTGSTATAAGTLIVDIGSETDHSYEITIADTDDATTIGDKLDVLVAADTTRQASSANTLGNVLFTAEHGGTVGDKIGIRVRGTVAGVTVAVTAMNGGLTDPVLTTLFDPVANERYQHIIYPGNWDLSVLKTFLEARFNVTGELLDGAAITVQTDTDTALKATAATLNARTIVLAGNASVTDALYQGGFSFELDYVAAAVLGALRSLRLTAGANIADITIGGGVIDSTGGTAISSKPYHNTPTNLPVGSIGKGWDTSQVEDLQNNGVSVIGNNPAGNTLILGPMITTYKTDSASNPDPTFKFLNIVDTSVAIREYFFNNVKAQYAQSRLTDGDLIPGVASANEQSIRSFLIKLYGDLIAPEFSLTRSGEVNLNIFKNNLVLTLDLLNGKVTADMIVPVVGQFREFNGLIKIRL